MNGKIKIKLPEEKVEVKKKGAEAASCPGKILHFGNYGFDADNL